MLEDLRHKYPKFVRDVPWPDPQSSALFIGDSNIE